MIIVIQIRNVFGNNLAYPVCKRAHTFARIAGTKTLSRSMLYDIEELGYNVKVQILGVSETAHWNGEV